MSHYTGASGAATGITAKVLKISTDFLGNTTQTLLTHDQLSAEGLRIQLKTMDGATTISETGTSDGIYLFTDASGGENIAAAHANSDLKFQLQRDDGSNWVDSGYNSIRVDLTPADYMVQMRSAGLSDNGATAGVDESKTQSFKVIDNFSGQEATLSASLHINVYTGDSNDPALIKANGTQVVTASETQGVTYNPDTSAHQYLYAEVTDGSTSYGSNGPMIVSTIGLQSSSGSGSQGVSAST